MPVVSTFRTFQFVFGLALLAVGPRAWAQAPNADAIARKAYSAHYDRAYLLGGFALPNFSNLNKQLGEFGNFPKLKPGALMVGAGYGQGFGSWGLALEWRLTVRANDVDSTFAYTNLLTNTFGLMGRYNALVTDRYTVTLMGGPTYNRLSLTFKEPAPRIGEPGTFGGQLNAAGNKRKLYQSQFGLSVGVQIERHFSWLRRKSRWARVCSMITS